jgi:hypothetical protein
VLFGVEVPLTTSKFVASSGELSSRANDLITGASSNATPECLTPCSAGPSASALDLLCKVDFSFE